MLDILAADVSRAQAAVALGLFVAFACALPVVIVAGVLVAHRRSAVDVDRAKAWLARYNRPVLLVLFAVVGVVYSTKGLLELIH
jgi:hypothetical protein